MIDPKERKDAPLSDDDRTREEIAALVAGMRPVDVGGLRFWELPKREDSDHEHK